MTLSGSPFTLHVFLICVLVLVGSAATTDNERMPTSLTFHSLDSSDRDDQGDYPTCTFSAFVAVIVDMLDFITTGKVQIQEQKFGVWLKMKKQEDDMLNQKIPGNMYKGGTHVQQLIDLVNRHTYYFETSRKDLSFSMKVHHRRISKFRDLVHAIKPIERTSHGTFVAQAFVAIKTSNQNHELHAIAAFHVSYDPVDGATVYGKNSWGGNQQLIAIRNDNFDYAVGLTPVVTDRIEQRKSMGPLPISDAYYDVVIRPLVDSIEMLTESAHDLQLSDKVHMVALKAAERSDAQTLKVLAALGVDLERAVELAVARYNGVEDPASVRNLLEAGAVLDTGRSIRTVVSKGDAKLLKRLLEAGGKLERANAEYASGMGNTAVSMASNLGHAEVLQILIEAGEDVNHANKHGETPALMAAAFGHVGTLKLLVDAGAQLDQASINGDTAILIAAHLGYAEIVQLLIKGGAKLDQANADGVTAISLAERAGHVGTLEILQSAGMGLKSKVSGHSEIDSMEEL